MKKLLVSNKHVLKENSNAILIFPNRKLPSGEPDLGAVIPIRCSGGRRFEHPRADIACIDITGEMNRHPEVFYKSIDSKFIEPIDTLKVGLGTEVLFVGYPNGFYDMANNLPLVRTGSLASLPNINFNGEKLVAIDAQVFKGSSGSPVFIAWDGSYNLLGIISRTVKQRERDDILGFGLVVKQECFSELLLKVKDYFLKTVPMPDGFQPAE